MNFLILLFILLCNTVNTLKLPIQGSCYSRKITIPLIGQQFIETIIINKNKAQINLNGIVNESGSVLYYKKNDQDIFKLSKNLNEVMEKFKCEFSFPEYNEEKDEIIFKLHIMPIYFKKIILKK